MKRMRRAWIRLLGWLTLCGVGIVCAQAAQAAISMSAPRDLPILARIEPLASLAVLENGSFAVAGIEAIEAPHGQGFSRVLVQFFGADGSPKGEPVVLVTSDQGCDGGVGSLGDHYFVTWQRFTENQTLAAFFDEEGTRAGDPFPFPNSEINYYSDFYRYGPGPAWRILPTFYHKVGFTWLDDPVFQPLLQVYDKQARALGLPFTLGTPLRPGFVEDVAVNGSGRFVVLEAHCPWSPVKPPQECTRGVHVFDGGGRPRTPFLTQAVAQPLEGRGKDNSTGKVAIDTNGNFLLLWISDVFGRTKHLVARLYDREGRPLSGVIPVQDAPTLSFRRPLALPSGDFLVPWLVYSPTHPNGSLYLQELQASNQHLLPPLFVASDINAFLLEVNGSGHGIVAWTTLDAHGYFSGAHYAFLTVTGRSGAPENDEAPAVNAAGRKEP